MTDTPETPAEDKGSIIIKFEGFYPTHGVIPSGIIQTPDSKYLLRVTDADDIFLPIEETDWVATNAIGDRIRLSYNEFVQFLGGANVATN